MDTPYRDDKFGEDMWETFPTPSGRDGDVKQWVGAEVWFEHEQMQVMARILADASAPFVKSKSGPGEAVVIILGGLPPGRFRGHERRCAATGRSARQLYFEPQD